jgi:2,4-dienoyl-CoA reductase-like NADH-dependent reductase (Old Yellow Enzyme family)/thioredoxin reductase
MTMRILPQEWPFAVKIDVQKSLLHYNYADGIMVHSQRVIGASHSHEFAYRFFTPDFNHMITIQKEKNLKKFSALFQPGNIGTLRLANRLIMPAMSGPTGVDAEGRATDRWLKYYQARARGGVGLVIAQCASVSSDATIPYTANIYDDSYIPDWRRLVDIVHDAGSMICIQVMHFGMLFLFAGFVPEGMSIMVPSMMPWLRGNMPYKEVRETDIDRYVKDFAQAARRVKEAGADAVELHACNGCLVSTFLSPVTNRRTDQYGGGAENRARFASRIVRRMREEVGKEFPILVRMNATDDIYNGITIDEAIQQAVILESAGADAISVTGGLEYWTAVTIPSHSFADGPMVPLAEKVKKELKVPVIAAGKINAELAEQLVKDGKVDFVAMGRPLLADPELPNKLRDGRLEEVRRCIYCNNCQKNDPEAGPGPCTVNPFLYREMKYPLPPAEFPRKVMIVGGGLAGMQAALFLAQRGHRVSLYEKNSELGGQWNIARATPGKESYATFTEYLRHSLNRYGVAIKLDAEVTRENVMEVNPEVVVVATGAVPLGLDVPGATGENVVQAQHVIDGQVEAKGKVVVVGGRLIGMEVAIALAEQGREVSLVTRAGLGQNGIKLERMSFRALARKLLELRVPVYLNATVLEITAKAVFMAMGTDEIFSLPADTVVLAVGMRSDNKLAQELEGTGLEVYTVGDCIRPRDAAEVAYQAAALALKI